MIRTVSCVNAVDASQYRLIRTIFQAEMMDLVGSQISTQRKGRVGSPTIRMGRLQALECRLLELYLWRSNQKKAYRETTDDYQFYQSECDQESR